MTFPSLLVDGKEYRAWTSLTATKSLDNFAHAWTARYVDRWAPVNEPWTILPGYTASLHLGGTSLITGYVTQATFSKAPEAYSAATAGRSITADLVDCAPFADRTGQLRNVTLGEIVRLICLPFGIQVQDDSGDTRKFKKFVIELGESAFDAIERACRSRGVLPFTTEFGVLRLLRAEQFTRSVELPPAWVEVGQLEYTEESRFSDYYVYGQHPGEERFKAAAVVNKSGTSQDAQIERWRPLVVLADAPTSAEDMAAQATWERNVRAGRSEVVRYTTRQALAPDGKPWEPGMQMKVSDKVLRVTGVLMLRTVRYTWDGDGPSVDLELTRPEAFTSEPYPGQQSNGRW